MSDFYNKNIPLYDTLHPQGGSQGGYATVGRAPRGPLASAGALVDAPPGDSAEQQLRYENDRLKLALAQRSVSHCFFKFVFLIIFL